MGNMEKCKPSKLSENGIAKFFLRTRPVKTWQEEGQVGSLDSKEALHGQVSTDQTYLPAPGYKRNRGPEETEAITHPPIHAKHAAHSSPRSCTTLLRSSESKPPQACGGWRRRRPLTAVASGRSSSPATATSSSATPASRSRPFALFPPSVSRCDSCRFACGCEIFLA